MNRVVRSALFSLMSPAGLRALPDVLRTESAGGILLLLGTAVALLWANSPWRPAYEKLRELHVGPAALHLDLSLHVWAADGLLTIFFFVVGLELKREIVTGELRRPTTALAPIVAAVGGMVVPAAIYLAVNLTAADGAPRGWAIPTATDIAFAVAVLAVVGRRLPSTLRAFLLTLAVVDDLLAIVVIAVFYTGTVAFGWLAASLASIALVGLLLRRGVRTPWLLLPLGVAAWAFMHASGIHSTIAGVLLGLAVPALARRGERESLAERSEHRWRPLSAGFAVPVFALFAAGVAVSPAALAVTAADPVAAGVALALVLGKPIGIVGATVLLSKVARIDLVKGLSWWDVIGVGALGGIGFTVSLLVADLAFGAGSAHAEHSRAAILGASLTAAVIGAAILLVRSRVYARSAAAMAELAREQAELAREPAARPAPASARPAFEPAHEPTLEPVGAAHPLRV